MSQWGTFEDTEGMGMGRHACCWLHFSLEGERE